MSIVLVPSPLHYVCFTPPLPALAQASFRKLVPSWERTTATDTTAGWLRHYPSDACRRLRMKQIGRWALYTH